LHIHVVLISGKGRDASIMIELKFRKTDYIILDSSLRGNDNDDFIFVCCVEKLNA